MKPLNCDLKAAVTREQFPLLHNQTDAECFVCHPELRDVPASGKCPECMIATAITKEVAI
jgi:hypothetical protein